jgi:hypothetical protein
MIRNAPARHVPSPAIASVSAWLSAGLAAWLSAGLAACGDDGPPPELPDGGSMGEVRAVVAAGSFTPGEAGLLSALRFDPLAVEQRVAPGGAIGNDPIIRRIGDELFVVNRFDGNNVTILDAATYALKEQLATGEGSNPNDVAVYGDELFVPAFGTAGVVVVTRGTGERSMIDLSALDPDLHPNCVSAYLVGDEIYVACEVLDTAFKPRGPGQIAVIDPRTHAVATTFALATENPFGVLEQLPAGVLGGDLVIPTVPGLAVGDATTGCVERIQTGPAPRANGCVVTHQQLGAYVARLDFQDAQGVPMMWMITSKYDTEARGSLRGYDLQTRSLWAAPLSPPTQVLVDLAACPNGKIVVADQTMAANGLRIYDGTGEKTSEAMPIGLRPGSSHGLACY